MPKEAVTTDAARSDDSQLQFSGGKCQGDRLNPFKPGQVIGPFRIVSRLGSGGMGVVYKAEDAHLRRVVALKTIAPSIAAQPQFARRFRKEAILAANLSHPNILPVHSIDDDDPPRFFAMELVDGRSLEELVKADGRLSPPKMLQVALQVCDALQHAHSRGILHRDIKPGNILIEQATGRARLTDFGIAHGLEGELADLSITEGRGIRTLKFTSPEQNLGQPTDIRSDIFSFGATLYYLLTARAAYPAENSAELEAAFRSHKPVRPSEHNPEVSPVLDEIILKMIAVNPAHRYRDCREVSAALESARSGLDAGTQRATSRKKLLLRLAAAVLLTATMTLVVIHWKGSTGNPPVEPLNAALPVRGAAAAADSYAVYLSYAGIPERAIDGDLLLGWRGRKVPGWLQITFAQTWEISSIAVWPGPHRITYSVSLSRDGTNWVTVVPPRQSSNVEGQDGAMERFTIPPTPARHMRVDVTASGAPPTDAFQTSVNEVAAYGRPSAS